MHPQLSVPGGAIRGGKARRSRRESCHAQRAFPARLSEQNRLIRASVRASQEAWKSSLFDGEGELSKVDAADVREDGEEEDDEDEEEEDRSVPRFFALSFSNSTTRSWTRSLTNSNSLTFVRNEASSSSITALGVPLPPELAAADAEDDEVSIMEDEP